MCGIAAIFGYHGNAPAVDPEEVRAIREQMFARGPDGEGEWYSPDGRVGLGHRRLSIIDLSPAGAQPMFSEDGSLAIVFNGEIYNYRQLTDQLQREGCRFRSHCDTEVLLHLYATRGEAMLSQLRGMYAFAIWDSRKGGLFLARDPFGIKPLYYSDDGRTVRLASSVKALRSAGKIDLAPDPAGHVGFFLWGHVPDPYTMYRSIRSVPAGHSLWVDANGARAPKSFCNITGILAEAEQSGASVSPEHPAEQLREALKDSVRHHLIADVPVGVFLSSGLDSTSIAALAADQGGTLRTVTLGFDEYKGTSADETGLAEKFAANCGATHQTIWVSRADFEAERDHLFAAMDRPSTDGVNTYFVSLAAKRAGLKVALSGLGGDELFAGYPSFQEIPRMAGSLRWLRHWHSAGRAVRVLAAPLLKRFTSPKYAGIFEYGGTYPGAYLLRRGMFMPWELCDLLDPEIVREGWQELQPLLRLEETLDGIRDARLKVSILEMSWYMRNQLLRDSDWAGMGHSVEIRVPLVDLDLFRKIAPLLVSSAPPTKQDMALASMSAPNRELLERPKTGFLIPVRDWLLTDVPAHPADSPDRIIDRGLRGWAKHVYRRFPGSLLRSPAQKRGRSNTPAIAADTSHNLVVSEPKRILVFRIGQLGDTLVALPAMWLLKQSYPEAYMALLCDRHPGKSHVIAADLLRGAGIFDEFLTYPVSESGEFLRKSRMASLLSTIRRKGFDTLAYLAPTNRTPEQIARDRRFFAMAGIRNFLAMDGFETLQPKVRGTPLRLVPSESELLLRRLAASGLELPPGSDSKLDLGLGPDDEEELNHWLSPLPPDSERPWIAVGPGSKMPAKRWSLHRFEDVITSLIAEFDIWPVVLGGEEDQLIGDWLITKWGRGYNAAGALGLRSSLAALQRCKLFLGNDTGTMHMAAAVGVTCVAIFSSRERPGMWYPHGEGHAVFRSPIDCEGCGLVECLEKNNACLAEISAASVLEACRNTLQNATAVTASERREAMAGAAS